MEIIFNSSVRIHLIVNIIYGNRLGKALGRSGSVWVGFGVWFLHCE